ncbi:FbpB family small basic protein [Texcoconibacillus texcoconensis]|uniref:Fur-regulated basic protein B n=1 Tax=Texcoconibacillus texcoconensis TaxID=1095777 RepID=A0A840QSX3_9BACI|nr:FbpB family small basic protein [Texcoconibacillus texcoconensis]MBB5174465.1 hypothetical protein [Texcoconibacillus texcoconensis]
MSNRKKQRFDDLVAEYRQRLWNDPELMREIEKRLDEKHEARLKRLNDDDSSSLHA